MRSRGEQRCSFIWRPFTPVLRHRQPFNIEECEGCEIMLLDNSDTIQIDYCKDCKIFIGALASPFVLDRPSAEAALLASTLQVLAASLFSSVTALAARSPLPASS